MRLSRYYLPLLKETPTDVVIKSHVLMLRAGMMRNVSRGLYALLPFGHSVLKKLINIICEECDRDGCMQIAVPNIQPASLWVESGRYDSYGKEMLRMKDRADNEILFGPTCEEVVTNMLTKDMLSSKSLPINLYQITPKFRDEIRPRFGVMRSREFLMFDAYSFDNPEDVMNTYKMYYDIFTRIFKRIGLKTVPIKADPSVIGGSISHEFQVIAESGENEIFYPKSMSEIIDGGHSILFEELSDFEVFADRESFDASGVNKDLYVNGRGIEIGHIFSFDTKYSKPMNLKAINAGGEEFFPFMGSYGIGVTRLIAAFIEVNSDENGIIWNDALSPFDFMVINLDASDGDAVNVVDSFYEKVSKIFSVIYDDKDMSVGQKRSIADLIGIPYQITFGKRSISKGECEIKQRSTGKKVSLSVEGLGEALLGGSSLATFFV